MHCFADTVPGEKVQSPSEKSMATNMAGELIALFHLTEWFAPVCTSLALFQDYPQ
ncbi:hypothetical protein XBKQ1_1850017 [Xenorhabdus bovienii str. kraussei Quebec]|uniref:Uncharacterized protein n=2 Tax=Xenorhabdus bovienii TaxID=40576 RepID=A0A077PEI8_XENBV|nr:hypothetical protein XBKQ1_1850017 [Xenorhabdus bovienii str. kraussei Quebec]CDH22930.1 hypothetical protein XBKB1_1420004 [Xenorhabdus bovienii str. kraussei Becker Underwood]